MSETVNLTLSGDLMTFIVPRLDFEYRGNDYYWIESKCQKWSGFFFFPQAQKCLMRADSKEWLSVSFSDSFLGLNMILLVKAYQPTAEVK